MLSSTIYDLTGLPTQEIDDLEVRKQAELP